MIKNLSAANKIQWLTTLLITGMMWCIPVNEVLSRELKMFFVVTVFNILLLAFSLLPTIVPAILLPLGYWIFKVSAPSVIYGAWGNQIAWVVLGGLVFAHMMGNSGLSKRLAYKCMTLAKGNFTVLMFILLIPGIIIAPFVPAAVARCAIFGAILISLCQAMGYQPNSPKAVIAFVVGYIVSSNTGWLFYTGSNANIIAVGILETAGFPTTFVRYLICNFIPVFLWLITSIIIVIWLNRNQEKEDKTAIQEHIQAQYKVLGKMTEAEIKMLVIMAVVMVLLLTTKYHPLNAGMIFCLAVVVGFLPGVNLLQESDLQKVNFSMVFLVTACLAIGDVAADLGAGMLIITGIMPYAPHSFIALAIFIWVISVLGNLLMTPLALIASLGVPLITLAQNLGFSPEAITYIFLFSTNAIVLPYEIAASIVLFGYGMMDIKNFIKNFAAIGLWSLVCIVIFMIPWFKLIGMV